MIVEIEYNIVPDKEFEEIKKNCTKLVTELLIDLYINNLKEQNDLKE